MNRRTAYDIIAEILVVTKEPVRKTRIVYQANLNFDIVKKYLKRAISEGLLTYDGLHFKTTELGEEYVERYTRLVSLRREAIQ